MFMMEVYNKLYEIQVITYMQQHILVMVRGESAINTINFIVMEKKEEIIIIIIAIDFFILIFIFYRFIVIFINYL
jgi:hypothetical protein